MDATRYGYSKSNVELRRKVHDKFGFDKSKEVFEKGLKTTNVQQLHELQKEFWRKDQK